MFECWWSISGTLELSNFCDVSIALNSINVRIACTFDMVCMCICLLSSLPKDIELIRFYFSWICLPFSFLKNRFLLFDTKK